MMSRKNYNAFAARVLEFVKDTREAESRGVSADWVRTRLVALEQVAEAFADMALEDNPNFQPHRFMEACGFPEEE